MPQPKLLSKPWASDGLKNNIPAERNGGLAQEAATYAEGFPSITMTPISVGGKPPSGKDMNGVLYEISAHTVWQNQGGRYRFDQVFCDAIGGYPKGAVLINDTLDTEYISLVDANTHNPNSGNNTGKWETHAGKGLKASTIRAGIVQLLSATNSDREDIAATPKAVKTAYDKAVAAESAASGAVKTSGSQNVGGEKTFTSTAFFKGGAFVADSAGDFAANQCLQIGSNNVNSYFYNKRSGKYLSMRNDGELRYDGKRLLNTDDLSGMMPVGAVIGFPRAITRPEGYLKADGSTFNQSTYPDLYRVLGGNKLPKLTRSDIGMTAYFPFGDIPDGWIKYDDISTKVTQAAYPELYRKLVAQYGSIDTVPKAADRFIRNASGRLTVGTQQGDAIRNITGSIEALYGSHRYTLYSKAEGAFTTDSDDGVNATFKSSNDDHANRQKRVVFDASRSVPTADEVRPKALAMVLCIKAQNSLDDVVMWIKAFGAVANAGLLDASRLAQGLQDKADRGHTHTVSEVQGLQRDLDALIGKLMPVSDKIGGFDIVKFPDGTMIQTYSVNIGDNRGSQGYEEYQFTWAVAFVSRPAVSYALRSNAANAHYAFWAAESHDATGSLHKFRVIEGFRSLQDATVILTAIGRWN